MPMTQTIHLSEKEVLEFTLGLLHTTEQEMCRRIEKEGLKLVSDEELPLAEPQQEVALKKMIIACNKALLDCELKRPAQAIGEVFKCGTIILRLPDEKILEGYIHVLNDKKDYNQTGAYSWQTNLFDNIRIRYHYYNDEWSDYFEASDPERPHGLFIY